MNTTDKVLDAGIQAMRRENTALRKENNDLKKEVERLKGIIAMKEEIKGELVYPDDIHD